MPHAEFVTTLFDDQRNPNKVTVAFTMGVNALLRGHTANIILFAEAVALGKPDAMANIDIGAPFEPVPALLQQYLDKGGRIVVCKSCMVHNGLDEKDIDSRYEIFAAPEVIDALMNAKGSLQIS